MRGSFNCEIANLVLCLALQKRITVPLELLNFSGVRDDSQDTLHTIIALGNVNPDFEDVLNMAFSTRLGSTITPEEINELKSYVVCDAHHNEVYPMTSALTEAGSRLARYDNIDHEEPPGIRRFSYINNPAELYDSSREIQNLCNEVLAQRDNLTIKNKVNEIFQEILLYPFMLPRESQLPDPEKAFRRASVQGAVDYIKSIFHEFNVDVNAQDNTPDKMQTALHWAVQKGQVSSARLLLELGADLYIENAQGVTPSQLIEDSGNQELIDLKSEFSLTSPGLN